MSVEAAAQVGTYRAGAPYSAVPANSPDQCVAACTGDAACKGWNFVRLREGAAVCEFLSRDAVPLPSAGSVSGAAPHAMATGSRLVRSAPRPAVRVGQPAPITRDVQPVPQQATARPASRTVQPRSATQVQARPQIMRPAPRFRHVLDGAPQMVQPHVLQPQMVRPAAPQPFAGRPPAGAAVAGPVAQPVARTAPVQPTPIQPAPVQPVAAPQARSPFAKAAPQAPAPQAPVPQAPVPQAPVPQLPAPQAPLQQAASTPDSLFGGLYDDVAVPAPLSPEAAADADAPIATAARVSVSGLVPGLAGGR